MKFEVIWPDRRYVDEQQIAMWFSDAVANGDISEEFASDPEFQKDPELMARELHSIGSITLGRGRV